MQLNVNIRSVKNCVFRRWLYFIGINHRKISGQTLDQFVKSNIFEPLEMVDTRYNPEDIERCAPTEFREDTVYQGYLQGRVHDEKAFALEGVAGHAGSIFDE